VGVSTFLLEIGTEELPADFARLALPQLVPPEWALLAVVALLFAWGFSKRTLLAETSSEPAEVVP
jgi:tryptophan-rich sensory protein